MEITQQQLDYQCIQQAIEYLAENFKTQPQLKEVADHVHLSPHHFQRLFTEWAGHEAIQAGYHPCGHCMRAKYKIWKAVFG